MACMACLYFFGLAISVCRYDYGNSELNLAIWRRALTRCATADLQPVWAIFLKPKNFQKILILMPQEAAFRHPFPTRCNGRNEMVK